jgi:hypothetical protein
LDSTVSGQGPVAGCCECGDEPSGSCATELVSFSYSVIIQSLNVSWTSYSQRIHKTSYIFMSYYFIKLVICSYSPVCFTQTGPYILRIIFLSNTRREYSSVTFTVHVLAPYVITGLTRVLYNIILILLDKVFDLVNCILSK